MRQKEYYSFLYYYFSSILPHYPFDLFSSNLQSITEVEGGQLASCIFLLQLLIAINLAQRKKNDLVMAVLSIC